MRDHTMFVLILHNIRSVHNVGSIFRTADAAGVSKIYLTGYTPAPLDRFGQKRTDFHKAALGAEETVAWEQRADLDNLFATLKKDGHEIVALEQSGSSVDYKSFSPKEKTALLLGEERHGITPEILALCDAAVEIPMRGKKESLNVSVAAGIALFRLLDR